MNLRDEIRLLFQLMSPKRRTHLFWTLLLMFLGIFAEMVTIGAVLPFLAFATDPDSSYIGMQIRSWFKLIHADPLIVASIVLGVAVILSTLFRLLLSVVTQNFVVQFGAELALDVFGRIIRQPYEEHVRRNSSDILSAVAKVNDVTYGYVHPLMQGIISASMAVCIASVLFVISPFAASVTGLTVFFVYVLIIKLSLNRVKENSRTISAMMTVRTKIVQESLGGIRDVILDRSQDLLEEKFGDADQRYRRAAGINNVIAGSPRFIVEAAGIIVIVYITVSMSSGPDGLQGAIPILGALALGALRLLPLVQSAWHGLSSSTGNSQLLLDVAEYAKLAKLQNDLEIHLPAFSRDLVFRDVSFCYGEEAPTLHNISFEIRKGEHIGVFGMTGSGKSTLLDLALGLLSPSQGQILIDGEVFEDKTKLAWQATVAHVPQSIFLIDDTITANIAFGLQCEEVDEIRLQMAAKAAQLDSFLMQLPNGFDTLVGERGVRISGGQRQRIGIARAIYKQPSVLILDEATSALDSATEAAIMNEIADLSGDVTVITAAHRQSTLDYCDRIMMVDQGCVSWE